MLVMKNIDKELVDWAISKIENEYKEDVALLIGQTGGGKIPTDEQNMVFDFFVPATERGYQLAQTFIIEDMGYDLYPMAWERLQGIADLEEPRMIFAFAKGEVIYAKTEAERQRYDALKAQMFDNLKDRKRTFEKGLEFLDTAQEIYKNMLFENSVYKVRKAAGGVCCYLMNAIAMANGTFLESGYMNLTSDLAGMAQKPDDFERIFQRILISKCVEDIRELSYQLILVTRAFFMEQKAQLEIKSIERDVDYEDLAFWYQEMRYTFRRISYYTSVNSTEDSYLLGCYLQIEFDAVKEDFEMEEMDLMGAFDAEDLSIFAKRAEEIETYILKVLEEHHVILNKFASFEDFVRGNYEI